MIISAVSINQLERETGQDSVPVHITVTGYITRDRSGQCACITITGFIMRDRSGQCACLTVTGYNER